MKVEIALETATGRHVTNKNGSRWYKTKQNDLMGVSDMALHNDYDQWPTKDNITCSSLFQSSTLPFPSLHFFGISFSDKVYDNWEVL